jgi:N-methylhydantoinase B/oxoprolinase/acetone carboxylase alpha subunit
MADLKAQISAQKAAITALTNLVIKIQKKVKA